MRNKSDSDLNFVLLVILKTSRKIAKGRECQQSGCNLRRRLELASVQAEARENSAYWGMADDITLGNQSQGGVLHQCR
jgi:hypothetical protein